MKIKIDLCTADRKAKLLRAEGRFRNGRIMAIHWGEQQISRKADGFVAELSYVTFDGEPAPEDPLSLNGFRLTDIWAAGSTGPAPSDLKIARLEFALEGACVIIGPRGLKDCVVHSKTEDQVWKIPVEWVMSGVASVNAPTLQEAMTKLQKDPSIPLPEGHYMDDSFRLAYRDVAYIRSAYNNNQADVKPAKAGKAITFKDLANSYLGLRFENGGGDTTKEYNQFQAKYLRFLKALCAENSWEIVKITEGHYEFSVFIKNQANSFVYFSIPDVRFWQDEWYNKILIRGADSETDYSGRRFSNEYMTLPDAQIRIQRLFEVVDSRAK